MALRGLLYQPEKLNSQGTTASTTGAENESKSSMLNVTGLQVTFLSENSGMKNVTLPWPAAGTYYFDSTDELQLGKYIYLKEEQGKWIAHLTKPAFIRNSRMEINYQAELFHGCIYDLENAGDNYTIFAEFSNGRSNVFHNYRVNRFVDISIGRTPENDIQYTNPLVSRCHATLRWDTKEWFIRDQNSTNGIYVNNKRVKEASLHPGDCIFIVGLRINIGFGFVSINDENGRITVLSTNIHHVKLPEEINMTEVPSGSSRKEVVVNRMPRRRLAFEPQRITIENPPASLSLNGIPIFLRMGSSMVMGSTALMAGNISMMLSTLFFPLLSSRYTDKQKKQYEEKRETEYRKYLVAKKAEIKKEQEYEESILNKTYPPLSVVLEYVNNREKLWERRNVDDDFLSLRMGYGHQALIAELDYPKKTFQVEEDPLFSAMYDMVNTPVLLRNVPIMLSLIQDPVCGIIGPRAKALEFTSEMIMQTTVLHSYDEVKLIIISDEKTLRTMEFVRYLPHIWNDQRDMRFLATSESEAYQISEYIKKEIGTAIEERVDLPFILKKRPYYVVFAFNKRIFDGMEILKEVMKSDKNVGVSVIAVFDDLPKDCYKVIHLGKTESNSIQHLKEIEKEDIHFKADLLQEEQAANCMRALCNISLKTLSMAYTLPKTFTFLEMFGVGNIEQLNISRRWKENNPVKSLAVPIGVGTDGNIFYFDIHEKFHGPHGLVAGMTGSGKSEFIITYILSLAANFTPDEVAFVLIDYKGGGLAGAFEDDIKGIHLPHVIGTITNLDGSSIQRSLMSIQSELMRRQRIFNEAKSRTSEGTMDIYSYQKLYRAGVVTEALPHLLIVSDEFAELKKQEPEFMDQLISAARIGRSLGVHLILATQKPAGVVDDQIWSNTKFRICLRVQDRNDSYDMIKRPEAAELKDTGRFYLQVGYNEYFALGQSGYCGAEYEPSDEIKVLPDNEIQIIDALGQPIGKKRPAVKRESSGIKQIVAVVQEISRIAEQEGFKRRPLWKEELPKNICLNELKEKTEHTRNKDIGALLGIVDDPSRQRQFPLYLSLQQSRNLLIAGETGSGKTTMLQTILYDLVEHYSPNEVNYYILDFSSRNLGIFRSLPHCGAFVTDEDEAAINRVFDLLKEIIEDRRRMFAQMEVSSFDAYLEIERIPLVFLIIDNLSRFEEFDRGRDYYELLGSLMNSGVGYGVKTIFSVSQINDCPMRLRRESGNKIALRARDRYVYTDILDCRCRYEPVDTPGRGICVVEGECFEYQTALSVNAVGERERTKIIREKLNELGTLYKDFTRARRIEIQDEDMTYDDFASGFDAERIAIGVQIGTLKKIAMPLQQLYCTSLYFGNDRGIPLIMSNLLKAMMRENSEIIIVKKSNHSVFEHNVEVIGEILRSNCVSLLDCSDAGFEKLITRLTDRIVTNKKYRDEYCGKNNIKDWRRSESIGKWRREVRAKSNPLMIVIESMADLVINLKTETAGIISAYFAQCEGFNIYFWAAYYPDDEERIEKARFPHGIPEKDYEEGSEDSLREKRIRHNKEDIEQIYNTNKFTILSGGRFNRQKLIVLPNQFEAIEKPCSEVNDNKLLLHYRGSLYSLFMPCGGNKKSTLDPDEGDII